MRKVETQSIHMGKFTERHQAYCELITKNLINKPMPKNNKQNNDRNE